MCQHQMQQGINLCDKTLVSDASPFDVLLECMLVLRSPPQEPVGHHPAHDGNTASLRQTSNTAAH